MAPACCQFQQAGVCVCAAAVNLALRSSQKLGFQLQVSDGDKSLQALAPPDDHDSFLLGGKQSCLGDDTLFPLTQISQTGCCLSRGQSGAGKRLTPARPWSTPQRSCQEQVLPQENRADISEVAAWATPAPVQCC